MARDRRAPGWSSQAGTVVDRLFAYGTFRAGESARPLLEPYIQGSEPATADGRIVAFPTEGYPGLIEGAGGLIIGELLHLRDLAPALALLDAYEGHDFSRLLKEARRADGSTCWAWCYALTNAAMAAAGVPIPGGDWVRWRTASGLL
jgi:gamma-glutamylcyclotransferase (GGCT)/AIG2-like uncharacterized protein YtfP